MNARVPAFPADPDTAVVTLANGARVLTLRRPQLESASVSVFVRVGSAHESAAQNGICHVVEHMVFKGTAQRDCRRINLDAERLGAEVNAHTDKDHTAFHMRGLGPDAPAFVRMLAELVAEPSFPAAEFERERQVLLHEIVEDEDDPMATAYKLFDRACFGTHGFAQPVIGTRRNIERFTREELLQHVHTRYGAVNVVVGAAGAIDPEQIARAAEQAFCGLASGTPNPPSAPAYRGGVRTRALAGSSQTQLVLGFPLPPLAADDASGELAAVLFGEGMSSPLLDELRERRGLVYHAACSADVYDGCGQFVVEAATSPEQLGDCLEGVGRLLACQAEGIDPVDLERARKQVAVRQAQAAERPARQLEDAALELMTLGRVRTRAERAARIADLGAEALRTRFVRMLEQGVSVALAGRVARGSSERVRETIDRVLPRPAAAR
jgi:predicted Zn-dependent peptidase